jgi:hypothetical protein
MQIDYPYSPTHSKLTDNSYVPRDITIPPSKLKLGSNFAYPTVVIEVGHHHESWKHLKDDARTKAFTARTSIQVFVGIKLYTSDYQMFWACRSPTGGGMNIQDETPKLNAQTPTNLVFTIPKQLIFFVMPIDQLAELGKRRRRGIEELEEGMVSKMRKVEVEKDNQLRAAVAMLKAYEEEAEELRKVEEARGRLKVEEEKLKVEKDKLRAREIAARTKRVAVVAAAQAE